MATGRLTLDQQKQLERWIRHGAQKFTLLYSFTRDGASNEKFHETCNDRGPTVTVLYNINDSVYGGYTQQSWSSADGVYHKDKSAFLFRLQNGGKTACDKFPAKTGDHAIRNISSYGPIFGSNDLYTFNSTLQLQGHYYTLNGHANFGYSYDMKGVTTTQITDDIKFVTELEVYQVEDLNLENPWRPTPAWDKEFLKKLKKSVVDYCPPPAARIKQSRILIIGPIGAGKSSFYNSLTSVFRGHVTKPANCGSAAESVTSVYRMYQVRSATGHPFNFRFCDTRGLEETKGIRAEDLEYILNGHVPDGFEFDGDSTIDGDVAGFKESPTLGDKIHCVCLVIDGSTAHVLSGKMLENIKALQGTIYRNGVPLVVLLTKTDKVCAHVESDVSTVFQSPTIRELVDEVSQLLGVPRGDVLPMKNYEQEVDLCDNVDILALLNLEKMLRTTESFIYSYMDLHADQDGGSD